jgi:hypothetical protein
MAYKRGRSAELHSALGTRDPMAVAVLFVIDARGEMDLLDAAWQGRPGKEGARTASSPGLSLTPRLQPGGPGELCQQPFQPGFCIRMCLPLPESKR